MAKNKDVKEEIVSMRDRTTPFEAHEDRFYNLDRLIKERNPEEMVFSNLSSELSRYLPVSVIACTESFFRLNLSQLIDDNKKFLEKATKLINEKGKKFDIKYLEGIQDKSVTIGEILSYLVSFNSFEDINEVFSKIIDKDFIAELDTFTTANDTINNDFIKPFTLNKAKVLESVKRNFEARHILAHEFATHLIIDLDEVVEDYQNQKKFIRACNIFFKHLKGVFISIDNPEEILKHLKDKFILLDKELNDLIKKIRKGVKQAEDYSFIDLDMLSDSIEKWRSFRKSYVLVNSYFFHKKSDENIYSYEAKISITKQMISFLSEEYGRYLK